MDSSERDNLYVNIRRQKIRSWQRAIANEASRFGCTAARVRAPSGASADMIDRQAERETDSIVKTFNRWIELRIEELYRQNPRGNRQYYISNLDRLIRERNVHKAPQIALMTEQNIRELARREFWKRNKIKGGRRLSGPPPVCKECSKLMAKGTVTEEYANERPCPRHIGCTHEWGIMSPQPAIIGCAQMWVG